MNNKTHVIDIFILACATGDLHLYNVLINNKYVHAKLTDNNNMPLYTAIKNSHLTIAKNLLKIPKITDSLNNDNNQVLWETCRKGYIDILKLLLKVKELSKKIYQFDHQAIKLAINHKAIAVTNELVQYYIKDGYTLNEFSWYEDLLNLFAMEGQALKEQQIH